MKRNCFYALAFISGLFFSVGVQAKEPVNPSSREQMVLDLSQDAVFTEFAVFYVKQVQTAFNLLKTEQPEARQLLSEIHQAGREKKTELIGKLGRLLAKKENLEQAESLTKKLQEQITRRFAVNEAEKAGLLKETLKVYLTKKNQSENSEGCISDVVSLVIASAHNYYDCIGSGGPFIICWTILYGGLVSGLYEIELEYPGCMEMLLGALT